MRSILIAITALGVVTAATNDPAGAAATWSVPSQSGSTSQTRADVAPLAPATPNVACNGGISNAVTVSWSAVTRANNYTVLQSTSANSGFTAAASGVTGTQWTSGRLSNGTYYFRVQSFAGANWVGGTSSTSNSRTISIALLCT